MEIVEVVVGEGGVLHVEGLPLASGSRVTDEFFAEPTSQEAWRAFLDRHHGALADTDFDVPEDSPPSEIKPIQPASPSGTWMRTWSPTSREEGSGTSSSA